MKHLALIVLFGLLGGCGKKAPPAMDVCAKLQAAGVASNCKLEPSTGLLTAAAKERATFDLSAPAGKTGQAMTFDKAADYEATVKAFDGAAVLAGRHRYGSASALVLVQLNSEASQETGDKARGVVDSL